MKLAIDRIEAAQREKGLSDNQLAIAIGVSGAAVSYTKRGINKGGFSFLAGLKKVWPEVPLDHWVTYE